MQRYDTSQLLTDALFRYLRVRYEDIATSPELAVAFIYYWCGLGAVPVSVSEWVEVNTNMPTCDAGAGRTRHLRADAGDTPFGYVYAAVPEQPFAGRGDAVVEAFVREDQRTLRAPQTGANEAIAAVVPKTQVLSGGGGSSSNSQSGQELEECAANTKEARHNPYGTKRQSAAMVSMWRTLMSGQDAQAVWEACEESGVMDALGYEP